MELFWSTFAGDVKATRLDGTGTTRQLTKLASAAHIEVDDAFVYVPDRTAKKIWRAPKVGGAAEQLATCAGECIGIALAGKTVYFTDRGTNTLRAIDASGSTAFASGLNNPEDAFATKSDVFVANENGNSIVRVPLDGSPASTFLAVADPVSVVIDGAEGFVTSQSAGTIYRFTTMGGTLEAVAKNQSQPVGLCITPNAIYWANVGSHVIMRLAR